jgi:hypothetical protein
MTWAADGSLVASMCDGDWFRAERLDLDQEGYHTHLYRIRGEHTDFTREDMPGYPTFSGVEGSWFGYGIISIEGALYATVSRTPGPRWSGPFRGLKLLRSYDGGRTWSRVNRTGAGRPLAARDPARNLDSTDEMFFLKESGLPHVEQRAYPFSFVSFAQCGRDCSAARDGYVYVYGPEGADAHRLMLARVPKARVGTRAAWEYLAGYEYDDPLWSADLSDRQPVHVFPQRSNDGNCFGWYSWLPSVVWNEGLGLFVMVNGGTYAGRGMTGADEDYYDAWMHTETGSLGFWYAQHPYGPWHEFFYTDYWTVDSPDNRTYQPKLSPKWIDASGQEMVLIWSDAMRDETGRSHGPNYTWNQMAVTIELAG